MNALTQTKHSLRTGWKLTGWQGLTALAPLDWNLAAYGGDHKSGSFRLDGLDSDNKPLGMEVRWSHPKGPSADADLQKRLEPFFAALLKESRRRKALAKTESRAAPDPRFPERAAQRSFSWSSNEGGMGLIWRCGECGRMCIAQVTGRRGKEFKSVAQRVLGSLRCHSEESGWTSWALCDLSLAVPTEYKLKGQPKLMNVYLQLHFQKGQSQDIISVEQWNLASMQVKDCYLNEWFRSKTEGSTLPVQYQESDGVVQGHAALHLQGKKTGIAYWLGDLPRQWLKLRAPAPYYSAALWECPDTNKIVLLQCFSRKPDGGMLSEMLERTECHDASLQRLKG